MSVARAAVRSLGELLITAGLVLLLFVAYQLVWTNFAADRAQDKVTNDPAAGLGAASDGTGATGTVRLSKSDFGKGFAFLHIPRLGQEVLGAGRAGRLAARPVPRRRALPEDRRCPARSATSRSPATGPPTASRSPTSTRCKVGDSRRGRDPQRRWFTYVVDKVQIVEPSDGLGARSGAGQARTSSRPSS